MSKEITFNLNEYVKVKLTEHGHAILKQQRDELNTWIATSGGRGLGEYVPQQTDEDGYTEFQLWVLIESFGPHIGHGRDNPFHLDIKFVVPESRLGEGA